MWSAIFIAAALAGPEAYRPPVEVPPGCRLTHYLADGRRIERRGAGPPDVAGTSASARSHARGSSVAQSSVAVSASSSSSSGARQARASATADGGGRTVTHTQDESGCRIVVDDRPAGDIP